MRGMLLSLLLFSYPFLFQHVKGKDIENVKKDLNIYSSASIVAKSIKQVDNQRQLNDRNNDARKSSSFHNQQRQTKSEGCIKYASTKSAKHNKSYDHPSTKSGKHPNSCPQKGKGGKSKKNLSKKGKSGKHGKKGKKRSKKHKSAPNPLPTSYPTPATPTTFHPTLLKPSQTHQPSIEVDKSVEPSMEPSKNQSSSLNPTIMLVFDLNVCESYSNQW